MEKKNNDELMKNFFSENKKEIPDNGFTEATLGKLPVISRRDWIVGLFTYIGLTLSLVLGIYSGTLPKFIYFLGHVQPYFLIMGLAMIPLVVGAGLLIFSKDLKLKFI